jgi:hypothetical protein
VTGYYDGPAQRFDADLPSGGIGIFRSLTTNCAGSNQAWGDIALQARVVRAIDLADAALAEFRDDLIGAEASPGSDGHGWT